MPKSEKALRQSVTLPSPIARRVRALAKRENRSSSRVIVDLIEAGLDAREQEKKTFFELADRLASSADPSEQKRLKRELARLTYGEWCRGSRGRISQRHFATTSSTAFATDRSRPTISRLKLWRESEPDAPDGRWFKDFGTFKVCGEGRFPKTFLLAGQAAKGEKL